MHTISTAEESPVKIDLNFPILTLLESELEQTPGQTVKMTDEDNVKPLNLN